MAELDRAQQHDSGEATQESQQEQAPSAAAGPAAVAASPALHRRAANRTKAKREGRRADADAWHEANPALVQEFNQLTNNAYGQGTEVSVEAVEDFQRQHPPLIVDGKITEKILELAKGGGAPDAEYHGDDKDADLVTALIHQAKRDPESKEVKEQLEKLNVKGLDRFIKTLSFDKKVAAACKELIAEAKELKEHQENSKSMTPHSSEEKKEGFSAGGYKKSGKKKFVEKEKGKWGAIGGVGKGNAYFEKGGEDVHDYVKAQEKHEKEEKDEKRKKEGFVGKHTHVGGTLASHEGEEHKASVFKTGETPFGTAEGMGGSYHAEAIGVSGKGSAEVGYDRDKGLTAGASASGKIALASGGLKLHAKPYHFDVLGEQFIGTATASVEGLIGIEGKANGELALNRKGAGLEVGLSGFAGAKVDATVTGSLAWVKKTGEEYAKEALQYAPQLLSHWMPASIASALPSDTVLRIFNVVLPKILGTKSGDSLILGAELKGGASAGFGAQANAGFSFEGGVIKCRANAGLTVGLGLSGSFDASIGAFDGMRCLAVLMAKGGMHVAADWQPQQSVIEWLYSKSAEAKAAIRTFCREYQNDPHHGHWARMIMGQVSSAVARM